MFHWVSRSEPGQCQRLPHFGLLVENPDFLHIPAMEDADVLHRFEWRDPLESPVSGN